MRSLSKEEYEVVSRLSLFSCVDPAEYEEIALSLERRRFRRGEVIYHKGDPATGLYIITKGVVKTRLLLADDRQITFHWFAAGGYFGMSSLFNERGRSTDAVAVQACDMLFFPKAAFMDFLHAHPPAAYSLLQVMAGMYRTSTEKVQDMVLLDIPTRIAKELLRLSSGQAEYGGAEGVSISQVELAGLVGASRESVNKWLRFFVSAGWISLARGSITVRDAGSLQRRVEGSLGFD